MAHDELITVGRILRSKGLGGEVVVRPLSDDPGRFAAFGEVVVTRPDGSSSNHTVSTARTHKRKGQTEVHVRFEGVESREDSDSLRGCLLSVPREALSLDDDEYFLFDLVGLNVVTDSGALVGTVAEIRRMPAQDLFVVSQDDEQEVLIPDVPEFVDKSHLNEGRLVVTPIDGLLAD